MARTKRKQARKYLPDMAAWVAAQKALGKKPSIVDIAKHFGFENLRMFCLWLAATVARLDVATKPDPKDPEKTIKNELHNTPDHTRAKALLAKLKEEYGVKHPEYFTVSTSGSANANAASEIAKLGGFDPMDEKAWVANIEDSIEFGDEAEETEESEETETATK